MRFDAFKGDWQVARRINDRRGGSSGVFEGMARFSEDDIGLCYEEEGLLKMAGQPDLTARQRYRWRGQGGLIAVFFDDGRPFHCFDPDAERPETTHLCGQDLYCVRYDFTDWPRWSATWQVSGPRKDYEMMTDYLRG